MIREQIEGFLLILAIFAIGFCVGGFMYSIFFLIKGEDND